MTSVGLIVSTYKSPDFLRLVLESVLTQTLIPDEVVITEDGTLPENETLIAEFKERFRAKNPRTSVFHLKQIDKGNRKPLALNRAVSTVKSDYLVFIDGDCILRRDFLEAHLELSAEDRFLTGRRVELSEKFTKSLIVDRVPDRIPSGFFNGLSFALLWDCVFGDTKSLGRLFRTPPALRSLLARNEVFDIRGCNFSVHRKHLMAINGFSNFFSGAYGEDSDVEHRLKFLGLRMASVKGAAIQFHLWHKTQPKDLRNQEYLSRVLRERNIQTPDGLAQIGQHA